MSDMVVVLPVIFVTLTMPCVLAYVMRRILKQRENVPLE